MWYLRDGRGLRIFSGLEFGVWLFCVGYRVLRGVWGVLWGGEVGRLS